MVSSALQVGLGGLQDSLRRMERAAGQVAGVPVPNPQTSGAPETLRAPDADLVQGLVDLKQGELAAGASVSVIRTADDVLGTLLDVMA